MSFKKKVIKALETKLYHCLGYRERRILAESAVYDWESWHVEKTPSGTVIFSSPAGSFEIAWTLPGYPAGTVIG